MLGPVFKAVVQPTLLLLETTGFGEAPAFSKTWPLNGNINEKKDQQKAVGDPAPPRRPIHMLLAGQCRLLLRNPSSKEWSKVPTCDPLVRVEYQHLVDEVHRHGLDGRV